MPMIFLRSRVTSKATLIGILMLASVATYFWFAVPSTVSEWHRLGGTISVEDDDSKSFALGAAIGHFHSDKVDEICNAAKQMNHVAGYRRLVVANLNWTPEDILSLLDGLHLEELRAENVGLDDACLLQVTKYDGLRLIGLTNCPVSVEALLRLKHHPGIRTIWINRIAMSDSERDELTAALGDRIVMWPPEKEGR